MTAPWLGRSEGVDLEYRPAGDLDLPGGIARHVVALLNSSGGHLVVGMSDDGTVGGVEDALRRSHELQRELQDRIRPRPRSSVRMRVVGLGDREVLEVKVSPPAPRAPLHAERTDGRWGYWVRVGAGVRAMDWDEIRSGAAATRWDQLMSEAPPGPTLLLEGLQDRAEDEFELDDIHRVLTDGANRISGNRIGWTVLRDPRTLGNVGGAMGVEMPGVGRQLRVERNLDVRFIGGAPFLSHLKPDDAPGPILYPYALTEGPASFARLLAVLGDAFDRTGPLQLRLGLWRVGRWGIRPGPPSSYVWQHGEPGTPWSPAPAESLVHVRRSSWKAVRATPDREVQPLVARLYEDFGCSRDAVPFWDGHAEEFRF